MIILVLPVSGGGFANQLAIMQHICETDWRPDVTLASSGGNVTAYLVAAARWKWAAVERLAKELNQDLFIKPWISIPLLSKIVGYFKGQIYNQGLGVQHFMEYYFSSDSIMEMEIWTGTFDRDSRKSRLFCNRTKEKSILRPDQLEIQVTQSMEPMYAGGDIKLIAEAGLASASIPGLVPPQKIENENYIDGCFSGASPLITLQGIFMEKAKNGESIHLVYVNSVNLDNSERKEIKNVVDTWQQAASDLVKSQTVSDRMAGFHILKSQNGKVLHEEFPLNTKNIEIIKKRQKETRFSLTEIYPTTLHRLSLENFCGSEVIYAMKNCYGSCHCRLWWVESDDEEK